MTSEATLDGDRALKQRHRTMWALGDYPRVATELISELGAVAVAAAALRPDDRVLDVAAGSGNASVPAAATGAHVVAADLTPDLLEHGRARAEKLGVPLEWVEADVEALPFDSGEFDVVMSVVGAMFAPHHQQTADEITRVCRPGGRIVMINWTPEGMIGDLFRTMAPYAAAPPPGASPPALWGNEEHVRELFGSRVEGLTFARDHVRYPDRFTDGSQLRDYYKQNYGPTIAAYRNLADEPERVAALDRDFLALTERWVQRGPDSRPSWSAEYLVVTATRKEDRS